MKQSLAISLAAALVAVSAPALAASGPVAQGTFAIGAERMMGIAHASARDDSDPNQVTTSTTAIFLFGNGGYGAGDARVLYAVPRIGLDYFIIDGLSLGGSFTLLHASTSQTERGVTTDTGSTTGFLFAPRVGYAYMFGEVIGIWPRGGISYAHDSDDPANPIESGSSGHVFAFDLDVPLLIAPVKNFAITVGPIFDVTFGGSHSRNYRRGDIPPPDRDIGLTLFGLSAGVVGLI